VTLRTIPSPTVNETEWQEVVVAAMRSLGWRHNFTRRTIGRGKKWTTATSCVGWPDLTAWHPRHGLIFVELKAEHGVVSEAQHDVLDSLREAGQRVFVWRPSDFDAAVRVLRGTALREERR
jgi:hypothetical protein